MADRDTGGCIIGGLNRRLIVAGALVFVVALAGCSGDESGDETSTTAFVSTTRAGTTVSPTSAPADNTGVPPLDCWDLLTPAEMFQALGADEDPSIVDGADGFAQAEVCRQTLAIGEDYFVEISPGGPSDFAAGTTLLGVEGEDVPDVGDAALWFGGPGADGGGAYGVMTTNLTSQHGRIYLRVFMGRPNVTPDRQRELAADLTRLALPRFPGVAIAEPTGPSLEQITFEEDPPPADDRLSLDARLLAGEARGDWTRQEGLLTALQVLQQEASSPPDFTEEFLDPSASLVILLAREQLSRDPDSAASTEIARLLDHLTLSRGELTSRTDVGADIQAAGDLPTFAADIPARLGLAEEPAEPCGTSSPEEQCFTELPLADRPGVPEGKYRLFRPASDDTAWTSQHYESAKRAVVESASKYEPLGEMPTVDVVLLQGGEKLYVDVGPADCTAYIYEGLTSRLEGSGRQFQQLIAREIAFCFVGAEFNDVILADPAGTAWWSRGLVNYMSGYVFEAANAEHVLLPGELAAKELSTTLGERSWTNWALFEFLHSVDGIDGNLARIRSFTPGGDHLGTLAESSQMTELYHEFIQALTDANVDDQGPGRVPYEPRAWDLPVFVPVEAKIFVPQFGTRRIHVKVTRGQFACYETTSTGNVQASWRPGAPGQRDDWELDADQPLDGDWMLVVTSVEPGGVFTLRVTDVTDDGDCGEDAASPPTTLGDCGLCPPSQYFHES